jgi:hypothetical protein
MAGMPGFCLNWDLVDLVSAMEAAKCPVDAPTNWMQTVVQLNGNFRYRYLSEGDGPFFEDLL